MPAILQNHHVLAVYDALGFEVVADPPGWIFVRKDQCAIMLGECPDDMHPSTLGCHNYFAYLRVDDAFLARVASCGVEIVKPIADEPWGMREFGLKTVDGHRIMIGHVIKR